MENFKESSFFDEYLLEGKCPNKSNKNNDSIVISKEICKKLELNNQ